ncbi:MAG TPA: endolytic transglycosylase MltG [Gammaproteobacteria bacterium]|nr:endolytic transglycosylase MltG [Gammaproteobacteria bacterium]
MTTSKAKALKPARWLGGIVFLLSLAAGWFMIDFYMFKETSLNIPAGGMDYTVAPGTSMKSLAYDLQRRGVVDHPGYLVLLARWQRAAGRIQAGEYALAPGMTPRDLLDKLVAGKVLQHSLTLLEGWTFKQMMDAINRDPDLEHTLRGLTGEQIMTRLGLPEHNPEGLFHPDTYHFPEGTSDATFLRRAYDAMHEELARAWHDRDPDVPYDTPYQALIVASIIEKETAIPEERPRIAGVLVRRLRRGMRLAVDPTVIYGLGDLFDGNLRRHDLRHDTPYNTYLHRGLPPTPIAMPGVKSIQAAMHPAQGQALYYVARGDGSHQFSDTLAEHREAVARYQLGERPMVVR